MCFTSLLDLQKEVLAKSSSAGEEEAAAEDIKTTERWLRKLKKAEVDYKNRDKSIGKRISKGLFEGKDAVKSVQKEEEGENEDGGNVQPVIVKSDKNDVQVDQISSRSCDGSIRSGDSQEAVLEESKEPILPSSRADRGCGSLTPTSAHTPVHSIIQSLYANQALLYSVIFVASVAVGVKVL